MNRPPILRILIVALIIMAMDQFTKQVVLRTIGAGDERVVVEGFFKFVHWANTGAAWSMFMGNNGILSLVALAALILLYFSMRFFEAHTGLGQFALGLIFGGILGNLADRVFVHHVTDFLYFYIQRRGGTELGFPAFNIADCAICMGVGLIFILSWRGERVSPQAVQPPA